MSAAVDPRVTGFARTVPATGWQVGWPTTPPPPPPPVEARVPARAPARLGG